MVGSLSSNEEAQLLQTIEMFEVITQSQPQDYQSLEILKEAYQKLGRDADVVGASKRIAQAYVLMGQLSSAILEYESILQRFPDDPDVLAALGEIESKANSLSGPVAETAEPVRPAPVAARVAVPGNKRVGTELFDDGKQAMHKVFVEGKVIHQGDFDLCWVTHDVSKTPGKIAEPFIQALADKGVVPIEKSLHILSDKARIGYLPLDKYEIDGELARKYPAQACQRWCVIPFDRMSKSILVATANPYNRQAALDLDPTSKQRFLWYFASPNDLIKLIKKVYR